MCEGSAAVGTKPSSYAQAAKHAAMVKVKPPPVASAKGSFPSLASPQRASHGLATGHAELLEVKEEIVPQFLTLSLHNPAVSTVSPTNSQVPTSSTGSPPHRSDPHGLPQTPPSATSYTLRTPRTHETRTFPEHSVVAVPYDQQDHGSPSTWSYGPSPKRPALTSPSVSFMGEVKVGRFLLVSDLPRHVSDQSICVLLQSIATLKALIATFKESKGYVIVVFFDPREAVKVYNHLRIKPARFQGESTDFVLHCRPISRIEIQEAIRGYQDAEKVFENSQSQILVEVVQGRSVSKDAILTCLEQVGSVMTLESLGQPGLMFKAEFYDTRMASRAIVELNGLAAAGGKLKVTYYIPAKGAAYSPTPTAHHTALFGPPSTTSSQASRPSITNTQDNDVFGPIERSRSFEATARYADVSPETRSAVFRKHVSQPLTPSNRYDPGCIGQSAPTTPLYLTAMGRRLSEPGMIADLASRADISARARIGQGLGGVPRSPSQAIPEQNRVFPERVFARLDTRTSVMVKDVPNKLSRQGLIDILNEVVPCGFDFVYLRFDFNNCCNVGYAFVNFTSVDALYHFIHTKVGKRWNLFSSEKVLQISYANIQGKQNLINKFRNSAVMSVMEQWRPQIFYSDGAKKGLPEPFPMADNANIMRRSQEARLAQMSNSDGGNAYNRPDVYRYDDDFDTSSFDAHYGF